METFAEPFPQPLKDKDLPFWALSKALVRILRFSLQDWKWLAAALVSNFLTNFTFFGENYLSGQIIDSISFSSDFSSLNNFSIQLGAVYFIQSLAFGIQAFSLQKSVAMRIKETAFNSILDQPVAFFESRPTANLVTLFTQDITSIQPFISEFIPGAFTALLRISVGIVALLYLSPKLSFALLLCLPLSGIGMYYSGKTVSSLWDEYLMTVTKADAFATESFSLIRTILQFTQENHKKREYQKTLDESEVVSSKIARTQGFADWGITFAFNLTVVVCLYYGASLVKTQEMTTGDLVAYILFATSLNNEISGLPSLFNILIKALGCSARVFEVIDTKTQTQSTKPHVAISKGNVEFVDVCFSYATRPNVLKNLSFRVAEGETIALVGPSGGGKSTIVSLLERLYETTEGKILIDDIDIKDMDVKGLRRQIGIVTQDPMLFQTTIQNNVLFGVSDVLCDSLPERLCLQMEEACRLANADEFIKALPDGYQTVVGERGALLSHGQRQRIAIARATILNPKILILDEATSALDNDSERIVHDALEKLMKGRTCIVIAHRLTTIRKVDRILYIGEGKILESGSHDELCAKKGLYYRLLNEHA